MSLANLLSPSLFAGRLVVLTYLAFQEWFEIWNREKHGAYRADICRLAALIKHGGVYLDDDVELFKQPWGTAATAAAIQPDTTFMSVAEFPRQELPPGLFQAVIGSTMVCTFFFLVGGRLLLASIKSGVRDRCHQRYVASACGVKGNVRILETPTPVHSRQVPSRGPFQAPRSCPLRSTLDR